MPSSAANKGVVDATLSGRVYTVVLNWPEKRNAMCLDMWLSLPAIMERARADRRIAAIVIRGAGEQAFAAGADLDELRDCLGVHERAEAFMAAVEAATESIASCAVPTISRIRGFCIGAGVEIALACDIRIASNDSVFAAPPAKLGANYSYSSTRRLVQLVGPGQARDMLFTGRRLIAEDALRIGLLDRLVSPDDLDREVELYLETLLTNSAYSIWLAKQSLRAVADGEMRESEVIRALRVDGFMHPDLREGVTSFFQRRPPNFAARR
ncbi:enoyl-CoA hydratase-related protein [Chelatococcus reniformis]|uniref:Enoyl-CoA hydratase n=1 Tax=Chelatococcus reniformis TaxID=1494448 RepID=A0A916XK97_9HYPH|nr:enoyl-CoA hydratase-related protein [Chelatococcus reniformis]GGC77770.1 enoyl-CoA hydratase [Chelatococcus reniformis]